MLHDLAATPSDERTRSVRYELLHTIGEGTFGKVKLARHVLTGIEVAVKIIDRRGSYRPDREVHAMKTLNHPNIVKLFEVIDTEDTLFLIMEHVDGGTLSDYLGDCGRMTEHEARGVFRQLMSAVHYCHQRGIVHRDLKSRNILLDDDWNVKLVDFGFSNEYVGQKLTTFCGTLNYVAPEILLGQSYDGPGVDVWSLGVILFQMVYGQLPFFAIDTRDLGRKIIRGQYRLPYFISSDLTDMIGKCLTVHPCHRGTLGELMLHSWTNTGQEELRPYQEPPCEALDPQVTRQMRNMGFKQEIIEEAVRQKKYDHTMATYLVLSHKAPQGKGRTIIVSPFPDTESSLASSHLFHSVRPSGWESDEPASPPASLYCTSAIPAPTPELGTPTPLAGAESGTPSPAPRLESETTRPASRLEAETSTVSAGLESGTTSPALALELGTSSPSPQPGPWGTVPADSTSGKSGAPERQPEVETPISSSGESQGRRGLIRRFWHFCAKHLCCGSSKLRKNKVQAL